MEILSITGKSYNLKSLANEGDISGLIKPENIKKKVRSKYYKLGVKKNKAPSGW